VINEANEPSSTCRLWRTCKVETSTPPKSGALIIARIARPVKCPAALRLVVFSLSSCPAPANKL